MNNDWKEERKLCLATKFMKFIFILLSYIFVFISGIDYEMYRSTVATEEQEEEVQEQEIEEPVIIGEDIQTIEAESTIIYEVTPDDVEAEEFFDSLGELACCVEAEAGNQGLLGKRYVVDVILNRVDSDRFPNTIHDVIYDDGQFEVVQNGYIDRVDPTEETFEAIRMELEERTNSEILFFRTDHYHTFGTPVLKHNEHYFSK